MTNITPNEVAVLKAIFHNDNHEGATGAARIGNPIWSTEVEYSARPSGVAPRALPGVVGSLVRKGLVQSNRHLVAAHVIPQREQALWLTAEGYEVARRA